MNNGCSCQGTVYLLHFDTPYKHARHYLGWAAPGGLDARLAEHAAGRGARLTQVVLAAGISWQLARTWPGSRRLERQLKNGKMAPRRCPLCCGVTPRPVPPLNPVTSPAVADLDDTREPPY